MGIRTAFNQWQISRKLKSAAIRKLNIGAGPDGAAPEYKDWVATDIEILDITDTENWKKLLGKKQLDNILAEHVWEHLSDNDTKLANLNCFKFLKKGGKLRIAVPDGFHPDATYIENVRPGGKGVGSDDHKILYTYKSMKDRLEAAGFKVDLVEYWDEHGTFQFKDWDPADGYIKRSRLNDPRNQKGELVYTSLFVDAVKE